MLTESLVLAVIGGAAGVLLAYLAVTPIQTLSAGSIPRVLDVAVDRTVLGVRVPRHGRDRPALRHRAGVAGLAQRRGRALKGSGRSSTSARGRRLR